MHSGPLLPMMLQHWQWARQAAQLLHVPALPMTKGWSSAHWPSGALLPCRSTTDDLQIPEYAMSCCQTREIQPDPLLQDCQRHSEHLKAENSEMLRLMKTGKAAAGLTSISTISYVAGQTRLVENTQSCSKSQINIDSPNARCSGHQHNDVNVSFASVDSQVKFARYIPQCLAGDQAQYGSARMVRQQCKRTYKLWQLLGQQSIFILLPGGAQCCTCLGQKPYPRVVMQGSIGPYHIAQLLQITCTNTGESLSHDQAIAGSQF